MEIYLCIAYSTDILDTHDFLELDNQTLGYMVLKRDTGYFIKLYEELTLNIREQYSYNLNKVITEAHNLGARLIELNCDV